MESIAHLSLAEAEGLHRKVDQQIQDLLAYKAALHDRIEALRPAPMPGAVAHVMAPRSGSLPRIGGK